MTDTPTTAHAELVWDDEGRPVSTSFGDIYFSRSSGLEESRFVFLQHNQLRQRWQQLADTQRFVIGETGFGTGLNFLAAWQLWRECAPANALLHFISVEMLPIDRVDLGRALALWPELNELSAALLNAYPTALTPGFHRLTFDAGRVQLTLIIAEASTGLSQLLASPHPAFAVPQHRINAWFLDGFAPAKNPAMWSERLFELIAQLSATDATAATFTCAGVAKRGLKQAGFSIEKVPGFGSKREMLRASLSQPFAASATTEFTDSHHSSPHPVPWWATQPLISANTPRRALIIGAGLAGCHTAHALATRGWQVFLLDSEGSVAQRGSGNPQGVLYAKLSATAETLADFNLSALQYAQRVYAPIWDLSPARDLTNAWDKSSSSNDLAPSNANCDATDPINHGHTIGSRCGVLQLASSAAELQQYAALLQRLGAQTLVQLQSREQASATAGIKLNSGGLFFANAGWLNPAHLCEHLCQHPNITVITTAHVERLHYHEANWHAYNSDGSELARASIAVICAANNATDFAQTVHLPLKPVRGQISYLQQTPLSAQLQTVLCGEGYIAPAQNNQHCLGASFAPKQTDTELREAEHQQNLARLIPLSNELHSVFANSPMAGRAALRATTPDYLPMVGPVADVDATRARFSLLSKNARAAIAASVPCQPGLFVNVGHGSRGLCYTPLCAELLASQINGDPPPLAWPDIRALHPARFVIRDIIRRH